MEPLAPDSYGQFLAELKSQIQAAQLRASLAVNRELVMLYWQIGRDILNRQEREKWGAKGMYKATALLRKGDRKLFEVAKSVGYDSDAAFSKAFKRTFGLAPREYERSATEIRVGVT